MTYGKKYLEKNNKYIDLVKNSNSISISVRQHRFSERGQKNYSKSIKFIQNTANYINKAVIFFKNKIKTIDIKNINQFEIMFKKIQLNYYDESFQEFHRKKIINQIKLVKKFAQ
ncbi:MAG: hypothetical protein QF795_06340 [Candidatus Marinimicrobia bacterium]|nr:hypothetical protein [Candidatus Neomarinimicrobiota bacterium]